MASIEKAHVVIVPHPSQGHMQPMKQLALLLHTRGFHITFVHMTSHHDHLIKTNGLDSLKCLPDFRYETIQDGFDQGAKMSAAAACESIKKHSPPHFRELLIKLKNSGNVVPPVTFIISDVILSFTMEAAKEFGIPHAMFWTASACGLMGFYQFVELVKRGIVPLKDESCKTNGYLETPLDWIPGLKAMRLKDMPAYSFTTNPDDFMLNFMAEQAHNCANSSSLIINTFYEYEHEVLDALVSYYPRIYAIGPLTQLIIRSLQKPQQNLSIWKEDTNCLHWLDSRDPKSVVYVNFGSAAVMDAQQLNTIADGLERCGFYFLWILRPDIMMHGDETNLLEGFIERTRDRGLIVSWCPQEIVLRHPSVGLFVTHCGWNSMLESVVAGIGVLCWAYGSEQTTNTRQVCLVWRNGMEIEKSMNGSEIAELVREMMVGDEGKEKRSKALEWKKIAEEATFSGGSSYDSFEKLVKEILHQ
jgi:hypothetical protein